VPIFFGTAYAVRSANIGPDNVDALHLRGGRSALFRLCVLTISLDNFPKFAQKGSPKYAGSIPAPALLHSCVIFYGELNAKNSSSENSSENKSTQFSVFSRAFGEVGLARLPVSVCT
jgi:hypothetical protein